MRLVVFAQTKRIGPILGAASCATSALPAHRPPRLHFRQIDAPSPQPSVVAAQVVALSESVPSRRPSKMETSGWPTSKKTKQPQQAVPKAPAAKVREHDDDVAGKAYDSRLMRRLLTYLRPYKLQAGVISWSPPSSSPPPTRTGPLLVMIAVDTYMDRHSAGTAALALAHLTSAAFPSRHAGGHAHRRHLPRRALLFTFLLELLQTYLMQWTGQKVMFDMRRQIFRHLQRMSPAFYDKQPVGRLVTRLTSDVDALNEMFTSGVLAIFEDVFTLAFIVGIMVWKSWPLALLTLAVIPAILFVTRIFRAKVRDSYRRQRAATARINSFTQEYVSGMSIVQLFNRERRAFSDFSAVNAENKQAWTDAIFAYAWYYPVVEFLSSTAIALVLWRGGRSRPAQRRLPARALRSAQPARVPGFFGTVTVGVLIGFIQYAQRFFRPIQDLSEKYNILQAAMAASERVFKLIDTAAHRSSRPPTPSPATAPAPSSSATSGSPTSPSPTNNVNT
jgi:ATP-binding cassette subfamily B multidrug efflux pump